MIRITYDPSVNAAYTSTSRASQLEPGRDTIVVETPTADGELNMDWKDGKLVGIEDSPTRPGSCIGTFSMRPSGPRAR